MVSCNPRNWPEIEDVDNKESRIEAVRLGRSLYYRKGAFGCAKGEFPFADDAARSQHFKVVILSNGGGSP